ncbi:hypothetical protein NX722_21185 [Endozoicomonas gorgoniicola]|uniref:Uncharacterized protein n=1 Tax=Endozoicomonas gorgoniicola TaxID=1234144 RepID=A0ABT3N0F7_9GAMM|nr:hypothetical protein [Endozoicomonas gorgoniicola]MCW7555090.1 hypothetical protein [Endozoicomonas gorgoniicola]
MEALPVAENDGTHQIEIKFGYMEPREHLYIDRHTAIDKEMLQLVLHPELSQALEAKLKAIPNVERWLNRRRPAEPEIHTSSQYSGFKNKLPTGEHRGCAWRIPSGDSLNTLEAVMHALTS